MNKLLSLIANLIFNFVRVQDKKIIFETGINRVEGNPKAIYDYIKKYHPNEFKMIWFVTRETDVSSLKKGEYVYYRTPQQYYHQSTAKYWIRSHSNGSLLKKKNNQVYIQTWHGGGAFKKCGYDTDRSTNRIPMDHVREWDYYIASDEFNARMIKTSTGYNKTTYILGMPRTDILIKSNNEQEISGIKSQLGINKDSQEIILYAPTFRDYNVSSELFELKILGLSEIKNSIILIRLHPKISNHIDQIVLPSNFLNVSNHPNIQDLLLISDVLITDYSSIIFDYGLLNKPIIFYPYDYIDYINERGGFYLNYENDLPGPIVFSEEELIDIVKKGKYKEDVYNRKLQEFNGKYNTLNKGNVSEEFYKYLIEKKFR